MADAEDRNNYDCYQKGGLEGVCPDNRPDSRLVRVQPDQCQYRPNGQPIGDVQGIKKRVLQYFDGQKQPERRAEALRDQENHRPGFISGWSEPYRQVAIY